MGSPSKYEVPRLNAALDSGWLETIELGDAIDGRHKFGTESDVKPSHFSKDAFAFSTVHRHIVSD